MTPKTANGGIGSTYGIAGDRDGNAWWTQMAFDTIVKSNIETGKSTEWKLPPVAEQAKLVTDEDRKFYAGYAPEGHRHAVPVVARPAPHRHRPRTRRRSGSPNSWAGGLTRIDTKSAEMKFIPFPDPVANQPYSATPDSDHNVWAPMWTTDQIGKYDPATGKWTMFDLPTRGTEIRVVSLLERPDFRELVFAYARSSKVAAMTFRSEAELTAAKAAAAQQ